MSWHLGRTAIEPGQALCDLAMQHGGIVSQQPLAGGVWNATFRILLGDGSTVVAKRYARDLPGIYRSEAAGLRSIAGCGWLVPEVLGVDDHGIVMEDLGGTAEPCADHWELLGRAFARLHGRASSACGFDMPTYWGCNLLANPRMADIAAFYRTTRFEPYLAAPQVRGRLGEALWRDCWWMVEHLGDWIPQDARPVLCHGDLWYGNRLVGPGGLPAVVDPAVHYGLAEQDLAHCTAYGGFDDRFYDAYRESRWLDPGWRIRCLPYEALHHLACVRDGIDGTQDLVRVVGQLRSRG